MSEFGLASEAALGWLPGGLLAAGVDAAPTYEYPSLGGSIAVSILSLGFVCLIAYGALRWLSRRGVGRTMGPIQVRARCPLEPRRSVYLIETAGRCFLVAAAETGMSLLAEVDPEKVLEGKAPAPSPTGLRFADVLSRALGGLSAAKPRPAPLPATLEAPTDEARQP